MFYLFIIVHRPGGLIFLDMVLFSVLLTLNQGSMVNVLGTRESCKG